MDIDIDSKEEEPEWHKLELGLDGNDVGGLAGLGSLDISFSTSRTKDGKFRVRVHSSSPTSALSQPEHISPVTPDDLSSTAVSLPSPAQSHTGSTPELSPNNASINPLAFSFVDADPLGPFLGAGSSPTNMGSFELGAPFDLALASSSSSGSSPTAEQLISGLSGFQVPAGAGLRTGERRRVRIALRSLPQQGGEGGEWEIEVR